MKLHDVSLLISEDMAIWPNNPGVSMDLTSSITRGDEANVTKLTMGVHTGTHIDAPFHFEPNKATVDQLPLEVLIGPCRVFEMLNINQSIGPDDLEELDLNNHTRILFKTKNSTFWNNSKNKFKKDFVHLDPAGAKF